METRKLGKTDIEITPLIFGTWQAGKSGWVGIEDQDVIDAMRAALDAGITTFDTAEVYGNGYSEELVGKALGERRDRTVLATKVFANHLKPDQVIEACENSLRRLQTDVIDLYQIHWPSGAFKSEIVPMVETMGAMNQLKEQGKIRAIGVSNFSTAQLVETMAYGRIDSLQPPYSLFWRGVEAELLPYCIENEVTLLAYSSLAQGLLTGKFGPDHQFPKEDVRSKNKLFQPPLYGRAQAALAQLRPIADRHHTTLGNLALAWLIAQPQTTAIVGARNVEQAKENAQAGAISLSAADLVEIDAISRTVTDYLPDDPVMWNFSE
ncbi:aldo/keto reductase [Nodosilinea sp. LEGE 07088]|uniref:aldo/keto reductase n=1 Tax=Nodosilinea sp. LEGE 07088 TaxID=2777968 RepID=UPI00187E6D99|nr:aldo/keto reductase [Nodosilinea sp. LEGE 07088]MBE9136024.1 aldo/keto reductase [Nodosilinea sp. LEGE 07088]